jgi:katanin p60 ATPase-containing subunit A1
MSTLQALRTQTDATTAEQKRLAERKKSILVLIHEYLNENGFLETARKLSSESNGLLTKYSIADNVDLMLILSEYEAYYEMKFGKKPKLLRKLDEALAVPVPPRGQPDSSQSKKSKKPDITSEKLPILPNSSGNSAGSGPEDDNSNNVLGVQGTSVNSMNNKSKKADDEIFEERCSALIHIRPAINY